MARGTKVKLQIDGQAPSRTEINTIAQQAVAAEDNAFSAIVTPSPYAGSVKRGVVPPGRSLTNPTTLGPNILVSVVPSTNAVKVWSHTAVVGPLDATANVVVTGGAPTQQIALANGSGNASAKRWDLIYATMMIDVPVASVLRKIKDLASRVISVASTSTTFANTVAYSVLTGTESTGSPLMPALPADPVGGYNIPLAYVRVTGNATSTTGILPADIIEIAEGYSIKTAAQPANQFSKIGTAVTTTGATKASDPGRLGFLPAVMSGGQSRFFAIRIASSTFSTGATPDGTILDDSVDWRARMFRGMAHIRGGVANYAWTAYMFSSDSCPSAKANNLSTDPSQIVPFMGQSLSSEPTFSSRTVVARFDANNCWATGGEYVEIDVDGNGRLVLKHSGTWNDVASGAVIFVWLDATGQFYNE